EAKHSMEQFLVIKLNRSGKPTRLLLHAAVVIFGFVLPTTICSAQNLGQNPGFEAGNTSSWVPFGPATISVQKTQVHSGTYAALVQNRSSTWNGIAQSMQGVMQDGVAYNASVWVELATGTAETVQLTMKKTDGNGDQYNALDSATVSATNWSQLSGQYALNISGTLTGLTLYVEVPSSATAQFYVDDLTVESATPISGTSGSCTVTWTNMRQRIDGFGASSAWRSTWSSSAANTYFSTNTGIGLSLLRTRIAPGGTTVENSIMQ